MRASAKIQDTQSMIGEAVKIVGIDTKDAKVSRYF